MPSMEKFCRIPPTALSLLSPPSIVIFRLRPEEPPTENVPTRALVGSKDGASVAPGMRIASEAKERPLTGKFSRRRWSNHTADVGFRCLNQGSCFSANIDGFSNCAHLQFRVDGCSL